MLRLLAGIAGVALLAGGGTLGYIAVIAAKRQEGVFLPAGYAAAICLVAGVWLARYALR